MADLLNINDENIGGVQIFLFAAKHNFSSLDPSNLVFKYGFTWTTIYITSETGRIDHEFVIDDAGDHYNVVVSGSIPKERPEIDAEIRKYFGVPCIVKLTDQNGYDRIAGTSMGDLFLYDSSSSGEKVTDESGYRVSFRGKQLDKAVFV